LQTSIHPNFDFTQIALWAFLVVLVAVATAAPRYFIIDDGEEGNSVKHFVIPQVHVKRTFYLEK
jgi:hypothetical protein